MFIPAAQRPRPTDDVDDTIVVVGRSRQKKRKRTKAAATEDGPLSGASKKLKEENDPEAPSEPFDFDAEPNLLDAGPIQQPRDNESLRKSARSKGKDGESPHITCHCR